MATITVSGRGYGPTPFYVRNGGSLWFEFVVSFDATVPDSFTYTVQLINLQGAVVKTITGSKSTGGQASTTVYVTSPGTDDTGQPLPATHYRVKLGAEAAGYPPEDPPFCSGISVLLPCGNQA